MIELNNVSVSYGKKEAKIDALKNINITIKKVYLKSQSYL